jgi:hypothetical protein
LSSAISSFTSVGATVASANLSAAATTSESTVQTTQGVSSQSQGSQSNNTQSNPPTQTASATSTPTVVLSNGQPRTMSDGLGRGSAVALLLLFAGSFYSLGAWWELEETKVQCWISNLVKQSKAEDPALGHQF